MQFCGENLTLRCSLSCISWWFYSEKWLSEQNLCEWFCCELVNVTGWRGDAEMMALFRVRTWLWLPRQRRQIALDRRRRQTVVDDGWKRASTPATTSLPSCRRRVGLVPSDSKPLFFRDSTFTSSVLNSTGDVDWASQAPSPTMRPARRSFCRCLLYIYAQSPYVSSKRHSFHRVSSVSAQCPSWRRCRSTLCLCENNRRRKDVVVLASSVWYDWLTEAIFFVFSAV